MANSPIDQDYNARILGDRGGSQGNGSRQAPRPSPLNRRPAARRLVTIFRGPSNTGKTHLALSMSEAGIGRVCVFDTEFKTRNVQGVNERFDAIESDPDTLLEDIAWAIDEKDEQGNPVYGGLVLDSWNGYFDSLYGRAIELAEAQRGEGAKLTSSEVDLLQTKAKKVLDLLCRASRRWVAITEHAAPQGQELDENEAGQLIIMTIGGTDYYSDVTFDLDLSLGGDFRAQHTASVVKTNVSHLYPLGRKLVEPTYRQFVAEVEGQQPIKQFAPVEAVQPEATGPLESHYKTLDDLLIKADEYGISEIHLNKAAARYCHGKRLEQLNSEEVEYLYNRLVESREPTAGETGPQNSTSATGAHTAEVPQSQEDTDDEELDLPARHVTRLEPTVATARSNGRGRG